MCEPQVMFMRRDTSAPKHDVPGRGAGARRHVARMYNNKWIALWNAVANLGRRLIKQQRM
jgi:hypothetical protein